MDWPFKGKFNFSRSYKYVAYDTHVFPQCVNKVAEMGRISRKPFLIKCNGDGTTTHTPLQTPSERLEELAKMFKKKIITQEEYDQKRKEILDEF